MKNGWNVEQTWKNDNIQKMKKKNKKKNWKHVQKNKMKNMKMKIGKTKNTKNHMKTWTSEKKKRVFTNRCVDDCSSVCGSIADETSTFRQDNKGHKIWHEFWLQPQELGFTNFALTLTKSQQKRQNGNKKVKNQNNGETQKWNKKKYEKNEKWNKNVRKKKKNMKKQNWQTEKHEKLEKKEQWKSEKMELSKKRKKYKLKWPKKK